MTSELEEKLRIFSCEWSKNSCLLLLQDLTDKGQWKLAIRSLLIYKIKGVCFRHFISAMPLSRMCVVPFIKFSRSERERVHTCDICVQWEWSGPIDTHSWHVDTHMYDPNAAI